MFYVNRQEILECGRRWFFTLGLSSMIRSCKFDYIFCKNFHVNRQNILEFVSVNLYKKCLTRLFFSILNLFFSLGQNLVNLFYDNLFF